jgi:hypothetical protein
VSPCSEERHALLGYGDATPDVTSEPNPLDELTSLFTPLGAWASEAACAAPEVDATIFDAPDVGDAERHTRPELAARQHEAISFCRNCPVQRECRQDAEDNGLTGIRGGVLYVGQPGRVRQHDLLALADAGALTFAVGYRGRPPTSHAA